MLGKRLLKWKEKKKTKSWIHSKTNNPHCICSMYKVNGHMKTMHILWRFRKLNNSAIVYATENKKSRKVMDLLHQLIIKKNTVFFLELLLQEVIKLHLFVLIKNNIHIKPSLMICFHCQWFHARLQENLNKLINIPWFRRKNNLYIMYNVYKYLCIPNKLSTFYTNNIVSGTLFFKNKNNYF